MMLFILKKKRCFVWLICYFFLVVIAMIITVRLNIYNHAIFNCDIVDSDTVKHQKNVRNDIEKKISRISNKNYLFSKKYSNSIGKWSKLLDGIYVYSAYIENCYNIHSVISGQCVKFIAAVSNNRSDLDIVVSDLKCAYKYENGYVSKTRHAILEKLPEDHSFNFTASLIYCPIQNISKGLPKYASLFERDIVWVPIQCITKRHASCQGYTCLAVCVRPFFGNFSILSFSEFVGYHSAMGVDHFILYKFDSSVSDMDIFVNMVQNRNFSMELLTWDIPIDENYIHQFGQIAFNQDCVARTQSAFSHVAILDFDEFIVPKQQNSLKDFVKVLDSTYPNSGSYSMQSVFFCSEFMTERFSFFNILFYNHRQRTPWYHGYRSRLILKPECVHHVGIHNVWLSKSGMKTVELSSNVVLLHHYRHCCGVEQTYFYHLLSFPVLYDAVIVDNTLIEHRDLLMNNTVIKLIFEQSNLKLV